MVDSFRRRCALIALLAVAVTSSSCGVSAETRLRRGDVYLQRRQYRNAIDEYKDAERQEPLNPRVLRQLGLAYSAIDDRRSAISYLERVRGLPTLDTAVHLTLGALYLADGRADDAGKEANVVLDTLPTNLTALNLAGSAYLGKNDPAKALDLFREIAKLAPTDSRAQYLVGIGLLARGNSSAAATHFESSLSLSPTYLDPLTKLVEVNLAAKRYDAAIDRVKQQIAIAGDSAPRHELLALIYLARGDRTLAESTLVKAMRLDPRYLDPYVRLSELYRSSGKYDQALDIADKGLRLDPGNLSIRFVQGLTYEAKGDRERAELAYAEALKVNPKFAAAANNLASLLAESGTDLDRALAAAKLAKESEPDNPAISDTFGWVLFKRRDYAGAVINLREAAAKLPEDPTVAYHLGMASAKTGDTTAARRELARAVASRSSFAEREAARKALTALR